MFDPPKQYLQLPDWHIPYLEKHKIYELFHEIARELLIQKPVDHVLFIKQILHNAANSKDVPRILLLDTPHVNCLRIAKEISKLTGQVVISNEEVKQYLGRAVGDIPSVVLVKALASLVRSQNCYSKGWIMADCIRDENDAKYLVKFGILPTHTILVLASFHPDYDNLLYCDVKPKWPQYRRKIIAIKEIFKATLREVHLQQKQISDVVGEIIQLSKNTRILSPGVRRVVILGPRGSGRRTQAKLLEQQLGLVHIDFEYILCSVWVSPSEFGDRIRKCRNEVCFHSDLLAQIVNKRIMENDCLKNGWVLTGFPFTDTDFKYLDSLDTPPNRVIFLECDISVCRERIRQRKINVYTGSKINVAGNSSADQEKTFRTHPKDETDITDAELNYYCEHYGSLRKYCGTTASFVNADQSERHVNEYITAVMLRGSPPGPPRTGITNLASSSSSDDQCDVLSLQKQVRDCFIKKI